MRRWPFFTLMEKLSPVNCQLSSKFRIFALQNTTMKQFYTWILALVIGALFGWLSLDWLNAILDFIATVYTRLFQFLAVPTLVLTITTTLASITKGQDIGRVFRRTITYTLLTTAAASAVGLVLFVTIAPGVLPEGVVSSFVSDEVMAMRQNPSYTEHILRIVPNNFIAPFLAGDVLSLLLIASWHSAQCPPRTAARQSSTSCAACWTSC